jgi:hypothetical protein
MPVIPWYLVGDGKNYKERSASREIFHSSSANNPVLAEAQESKHDT